jgi:hypothetical protein
MYMDTCWEPLTDNMGSGRQLDGLASVHVCLSVLVLRFKFCMSHDYHVCWYF